MSGRDAYKQIKEMLRGAGIEEEEAGHEAGLLFFHVCGATRFERETLDEGEWAALQALASRRVGREPLQYILGKWPFLDMELAVGPGVLIPRPETEEVCLWAAALVQAEPSGGAAAPEVLDLCAGSGALALGLGALLPGARVAAVEKEAAAFGWLQKNVDALDDGTGRVCAVLADALAYHETLPDASLDLIVSNPPYVTEEEYTGLAPELRFEPRSALVAGEKGLAFYRAIARDYLRVLKPGGWLVFETGAGQGGALYEILQTAGYKEVRLARDACGNQRMAAGRRPDPSK